MANFWSVNVLTANREWQILDPWPGPARILPVAASCGGSFYLFSGCELYPDDEGKAAR
jgi:N-acetylneuraminic acid mutarotase